MADHNVDWDTCAHRDCVGVRLPTGGKCWAHAAAADLDSALKRLGEHGHLDARGVPITQALLGRLLAAAPQDHGHALLTDARFDRATFQGGDTEFVNFVEVTVKGFAWFDRATFQGTAGFDGATFQDTAWFVGATFQRARELGPMLVRKSLLLDEAVFHERAQIKVAAAAVCCRRAQFPAGSSCRCAGRRSYSTMPTWRPRRS